MGALVIKYNGIASAIFQLQAQRRLIQSVFACRRCDILDAIKRAGDVSTEAGTRVQASALIGL